MTHNETFSDLASEELAMAHRIVHHANVALHEAVKRVRLWAADPKLNEQRKAAQARLGPDAFVTGAEWGGENMDELHVTVAPQPYGVVQTGELFVAPPEEHVEAMRSAVAKLTLSMMPGRPYRASFRRPTSALPMIAVMGLCEDAAPPAPSVNSEPFESDGKGGLKVPRKGRAVGCSSSRSFSR